uniref:Uncharacterized protein n=1 Tax=Vespula pensylvanica TaxID=30213 RepID=A0A834NGB4_VESPE|nr:hypothetical protein H0235_014595 [Vespula pensylvanica]
MGVPPPLTASTIVGTTKAWSSRFKDRYRRNPQSNQPTASFIELRRPTIRTLTLRVDTTTTPTTPTTTPNTTTTISTTTTTTTTAAAATTTTTITITIVLRKE